MLLDDALREFVDDIRGCGKITESGDLIYFDDVRFDCFKKAWEKFKKKVPSTFVDIIRKDRQNNAPTFLDFIMNLRPDDSVNGYVVIGRFDRRITIDGCICGEDIANALMNKAYGEPDEIFVDDLKGEVYMWWD